LTAAPELRVHIAMLKAVPVLGEQSNKNDRKQKAGRPMDAPP
jgi:hypothetical protein